MVEETVGGYIFQLVLLIIGIIWAVHRIEKEKRDADFEDRLFWIRKEAEDRKRKEATNK